jgi:hypothetical protein
VLATSTISNRICFFCSKDVSRHRKVQRAFFDGPLRHFGNGNWVIESGFLDALLTTSNTQNADFLFEILGYICSAPLPDSKVLMPHGILEVLLQRLFTRVSNWLFIFSSVCSVKAKTNWSER